MKTFMANPAKIDRKWYVVDAEGQTLGRLASEVAKVLRGKNKPEFTPHIDTGDYVIVINAEKVEVTGKKRKEKIYKRHTGYPGGLKEIKYRKLMQTKSTFAFKEAVRRMLPKGRVKHVAYLDDTGAGSEEEDIHTHYEYSAFTSAYESQEYFYLLLDQRHAMALDKAGLTRPDGTAGEELVGEVRDYLSQKLSCPLTPIRQKLPKKK